MVELGNKIENNLWIMDFEWPVGCMHSTNDRHAPGRPI
jgi:hypothetical protein